MAKYMIPNEFPSDLFEFAKPHAQGQWTSYPTYSYEQFYRANPRGQHNPADPKARYKALQAVADDDRANENERKIARRLMSKMEAEGLVKPKKAKKNPGHKRRASTATLGERVRVFRNLHTESWSVESATTGRIVAHPDTVLLEDVRLVSRDAGREEARRTGKKNVHAVASGTLVALDGPAPTDLDRWTPLYYNPFKVDTFVEFVHGKTGKPVRGALMWFAAADHKSQFAKNTTSVDPGPYRAKKAKKAYANRARRNSGEPIFIPVAGNAGRFTPNIFPYGVGGRPAIYPADPAAKGNPRPGKYKSVQEAGGLFAIPEKAPREGSFPIDTIKRARYALALVAAPAFDEKPSIRARVIKAVVAEYPQLRAEADHVRDRVEERAGRSQRAAANPRRRR